ncbi:ferritin-like domain-containing protein [Hymenobacter sp. BT730]|uniref:ferritin-like domain-containing protein n=1 Tax=Hymenobacter sp. BT730 TaxID=3063332 RepID=UPI0034A40837
MKKDLLVDIRQDEIVHREWFREVLALKKVPKLPFDFSSVNFAGRTSVLTMVLTLEDVGTQVMSSIRFLSGVFCSYSRAPLLSPPFSPRREQPNTAGQQRQRGCYDGRLRQSRGRLF